MKNRKKILITSALPYANGPIHFGHIAGAYLPADCYARFERLMKNDVIYICGSDEYGVAISLSAEMAKRSPKEHVDIFHKINSEFFERLDFSFDHFSRTTSKFHQPVVQKFFKDLYENGYIEKRTEKHLFSEEEQKFLADRYVIGTCPKCGFEEARGDECQKCGASYEATDLISPRSKLTQSSLKLKPSTHWYLRFDLFKEKLLDWIKDKKWKPNVEQFTMQYIKDLKARAITRDAKWGIPVPLDEAKDKVLYVWFDAPIGYISATMEWASLIQKPDKWKDYWFDQETKLVHFVGKDNIPFHTIFFPAMIMGQNDPYVLPDQVPANEFFLLEGRQFSKSDGWYIDLDDFFTKYSTDQIRYYLASNAPENQDSDFSWKEFGLRCNAELLGKFGNFVHRVVTFAKSRCNNQVPAYNLQADDKVFLEKIIDYINKAEEAYSNFHLRKASQIVMELAHLGNTYFDNKKPWVLAKDEEKKEAMNTTIYCCLECIKSLALIAYPIIPSSSKKIWEILGYTSNIEEKGWSIIKNEKIPSLQTLRESKPLFQKIENERIEEEINKLKK
jgi:methionyl-tRNA synthetase